jgi:hypothetical protein
MGGQAPPDQAQVRDQALNVARLITAQPNPRAETAAARPIAAWLGAAPTRQDLGHRLHAVEQVLNRHRELFTLRRGAETLVAAAADLYAYLHAEDLGRDGADEGEVDQQLTSAAEIAQMDTWPEINQRGRVPDVPADLPAAALTRFYWPISDGLERAGLAIVHDGGKLVARVVGMSRRNDDYEPVTFAQIDLSELVKASAEPWRMRRVYADRAALAAVLATRYPATLCANDPDEPDRQVLYIQTPAGQVSYHIDPADEHWFTHLPSAFPGGPDEPAWDGHTRADKNQRLAELITLTPQGQA